VILASLSVCEAIFGLFRVFIFVAPALTADGPFHFANIANVTDRIFIAFVLDWSSSIMQTLMGICISVLREQRFSIPVSRSHSRT
jgi:hypothetical protein